MTTAVSASPELSATTTYKIEALGDGSERRTVTRPDQIDFKTVSTPEGTSTTTYVDGTTVTIERTSDPRFGTQAPFAKAMTIATGGKTLSLSMARAAALANAKDPLSATSLTETVTVNGKTFTRAYDAAARKLTGTNPSGWVNAITTPDGTDGTRITGFLRDDNGNLTTLTKGLDDAAREHASCDKFARYWLRSTAQRQRGQRHPGVRKPCHAR